MDKNDNDNDDVRGAYQCQDVGYLACMLLVTLPIFLYSLSPRLLLLIVHLIVLRAATTTT